MVTNYKIYAACILIAVAFGWQSNSVRYRPYARRKTIPPYPRFYGLTGAMCVRSI